MPFKPTHHANATHCRWQAGVQPHAPILSRNTAIYFSTVSKRKHLSMPNHRRAWYPAAIPIASDGRKRHVFPDRHIYTCTLRVATSWRRDCCCWAFSVASPLRAWDSASTACMRASISAALETAGRRGETLCCNFDDPAKASRLCSGVVYVVIALFVSLVVFLHTYILLCAHAQPRAALPSCTFGLGRMSPAEPCS